MGHDPLAPGMAPVLTRVLAVGGDATRLHNLVTNLGLLGYQVTSSTDPAAAMAGLRLQLHGGQGFSFHVVMVDTFSEYPGGARAVALELFEFALREPRLCAYAIRKEKTYGPLAMEELDKIRKHIYTIEQNGPKSPEATPDGHITSPSIVSTITNLPFSRRRVGRRSRNHISNTDSQEVGRDGEHAENEQQQSSHKPKRPRVVWTDELHKKFVAAYNKLPHRAAVPKKILELMNDPTLTRENIASHLQKHRLGLVREACTDPPLRRSHSRTKQHRSTPQATFPAPNMSRQQDPTIMHGSAAVYGNHLVIHMQTLNAMDKSNKPVLVDVSPKGMCPRDDDPKQNSACCVSNSDGNSLHEDDISMIWNKEPEPSWDEEFLSNGD